ncbi:amidohydrolase family protein [Pseudomonas chlororaphis subsp. aurantiaca]|uniref:amidohydrolase family protein n=1 Tax=Pseudomonas chlororaphis TaxID=587753 RepID=UPI0030CA1688
MSSNTNTSACRPPRPRRKPRSESADLGQAKKPVSHYFSHNFYLSSARHVHTKDLLEAISEIGVDRVLFSADYPYESMATASNWFDQTLISENDREKIGRGNARRLFGLK